MCIDEEVKELFLLNDCAQQYFFYERNKKLFKDCTFISFSDICGMVLPSFLQKDGETYATIHLGKYGRFYAFNEKIMADPVKASRYKYAVDIGLALDTQIVSYLAKVFVDYGKVEIYSKYSEIIEYLLTPELNCNCFLYLIENAVKVSKINERCVHDTIKSFLLFSNFNVKRYLYENRCEYNKSEEEIEAKTDEIYKKVISGEVAREFHEIVDLQSYIYIILLKTAIIELGNSKTDQHKKMKELVDYLKCVSGIFLSRELEVCYYFFGHDKRVQRFFKKIQKNSKDIVKTIIGMSWDLTHIRLIERVYACRTVENVDFSICCGMTSDKGLQEIMQINPIKQLVIENNRVIPDFSYRWYADVPEVKEFVDEKCIKKNIGIANMEYVIQDLERELNSIMNKV